MKKFVIIIFLLLLTIPASQVVGAAPADIAVYVNGSKISLESKPIIVNNYAMLPLRDTFKIVGCDNVSWDNQTKTVTAISGEMVLTLKVGDNLEGGQSPVLSGSRVYLPIRYISNTFDSYINYLDRNIYIVTPFLFKNGQWYTSGWSISNDQMQEGKVTSPSAKSQVVVDNQRVIEIGEKIYYPLNIVSWTLGRETLYVLDSSNGKFKYLMPMFGGDYYIIDEDMLYLQSGSWGVGFGSYLTRIDLSVEPIQSQSIGQENFSYGAKLVLNKDGDTITYTMRWKNWELKPEGLYAMGYQREAALEGEVRNMSLLEKTYGYYLIDLETNTHKLIKEVPLEYK